MRSEDAGRRAGELFELVVRARWEQVRADFEAAMLERLPTEDLAAGWATVTAQVGAFERMGVPGVRQVADDTIVDVPLHFSGGEMTGRVTYRAAGAVAGLFILDPGYAATH